MPRTSRRRPQTRSSREQRYQRRAAKAAQQRALEDVRQNQTPLQDLPAQLRADPEIVQAAVETNGFQQIKHASMKLQRNEKFVANMIATSFQGDGDADVLRDLGEIWLTKTVVKAWVATDNFDTLFMYSIEDDSWDFLDDKDVIASLVSGKANWREILVDVVFHSQLKPHWIDDKNTLLTIVRNCKARYGSLEERDINLIQEIMEITTFPWKNDKDIMLEMVTKFPGGLGMASPALRNDYYVVTKAVGIHDCALKFASRRLRNNKKIILTALHALYHYQTVWESVPLALKRDREVVMKALEASRYSAVAYKHIWRDLSGSLRHDKALVQEFLHRASKSPKAGRIWRGVPESLRNDFEVITDYIHYDVTRVKELTLGQQSKIKRSMLAYVKEAVLRDQSVDVKTWSSARLDASWKRLLVCQNGWRTLLPKSIVGTILSDYAGISADIQLYSSIRDVAPLLESVRGLPGPFKPYRDREFCVHVLKELWTDEDGNFEALVPIALPYLVDDSDSEESGAEDRGGYLEVFLELAGEDESAPFFSDDSGDEDGW